MALQLRIQGRFGFRDVQLVKTEAHSLGSGAYGAVYRAKCDQLVCAAKVLHPILFQTRDPSAYRIVERFQGEIDFLSGLRHPNIIQYLGSCPDPETRLPVLFMELMDESLTSFLEQDTPPLPLHVQVDIAHDVAQALSHLHHHEVLHRDLSSNNVLLIGQHRAKVTDFGMAKVLGMEPGLAQTYCPGTSAYMSPEALAEPPSYTAQLDVFSCGVLLVQLVTRKFPDPGPRTRKAKLHDSSLHSTTLLEVVPEQERRGDHIQSIPPDHPLLKVALDCLKDKDVLRPTSEQLCSRLISLKESQAYTDSLQQTEKASSTTEAPQDSSFEEIQLKCDQEREGRINELSQQVSELQAHTGRLSYDVQQKEEVIQQRERVIREKEHTIHQKDGEIGRQEVVIQRQENLIRRKTEQLQQKEKENRCLQEQLRTASTDSQDVVAALQQAVEQRGAALKSKEKELHKKDLLIEQLLSREPSQVRSAEQKYPQQQKKEKHTGLADKFYQKKCEEVSSNSAGLRQRKKADNTEVGTDQEEEEEEEEKKEKSRVNLNLEWKPGPSAPCAIRGESTAVGDGVVYFCEGIEGSNVVSYTVDTGKWATLPVCPRNFFSIAVVDGHLTAIGGKQGDKYTNTLLGITSERGWLRTWQKWVEIFPPMLHPHNNTAVVTTRVHLIVAGGWGPQGKSDIVEVMEVKYRTWSQVSSLPQPLCQASIAHFGGRMYLGGGYSEGVNKGSVWTNAVVACEVSTLLGSSRRDHWVWKEVTHLPAMMSTLVAFSGQMLALGGSVSGKDSDLVYHYNSVRNAWNIIGQMGTSRCHFFAVALSSNQLMVVGGSMQEKPTGIVEFASRTI